MNRPIPSGSPEISPSAALFALRRDPLGFVTKMAREHGDAVRFRLGDHANDLYLISHPDYIRDVLVTQDRNFARWYAVDRVGEVVGQGLLASQGDFHRRQRRLVQPAFHRDRISSYANQMTALAIRVRERWRDGAVVDICDEMNWLALMIVASTLFGADVEADAAEIRAALSEILEQFERSTLPAADRIDFETQMARLDTIVQRFIQQRRSNPGDRGDLLSMLLLAEDSEADGMKMSDEQVRDEVMTIFLAGHETTATELGWIWYLLAQNPGSEARLHEELDRVLGGRTACLEDMANLDLTSRIIAEALRLYPPVWAVGRRALRDTQIADVLIPEGSVVLISQWVTNRDPRWFPNPETFDPDRWTPEARAARPRFSYFPFSAGTRSCLGETFATMEATLCLATLAQKWKLRLLPDQQIALQPQLTLRARNGIKMRIEARA